MQKIFFLLLTVLVSEQTITTAQITIHPNARRLEKSIGQKIVILSDSNDGIKRTQPEYKLLRITKELGSKKIAGQVFDDGEYTYTLTLLNSEGDTSTVKNTERIEYLRTTSLIFNYFERVKFVADLDGCRKKLIGLKAKPLHLEHNFNKTAETLFIDNPQTGTYEQASSEEEVSLMRITSVNFSNNEYLPYLITFSSANGKNYYLMADDLDIAYYLAYKGKRWQQKPH